MLYAIARCENRCDGSCLTTSNNGFSTRTRTAKPAATKAPSGPLNTAYAATYPLAMILKIILAQVLLALA